jgi:D-glycero-alpha-D-manno-heptose-7-phosphate kinase
MGSSSSFTVGLLNGLYGLKGNIISKHQLAVESIKIEQEILKETVGSQDQVMAAYGGFNHIEFFPNGEISIRPITLSHNRMEELNNHIMLFYTGIKRTASDIAESYVCGMNGKSRELRLLKDLVNESIDILGKGSDLNLFGELLNEAWQVKRCLSSKVTNPIVDEIYDQAISAGAVGGKLLGAGGGGFMMLFGPPEKHKAIREKLNKFIFVPIKFDFSGSQIIYYDYEEDFSNEEKVRASQQIEDFKELEHIEQAQLS